MSTNINISGEGVFATKPFKKGDFLLEYKGDLITRVKHARQLEKEYEKEGQGSFMYFLNTETNLAGNYRLSLLCTSNV